MKAADKARLGERLLAYFRASGCEVQALSLSFNHGARPSASLRNPGVWIYRLSSPFASGRFQEREDVFACDGPFNASWRYLMKDVVDRYCEGFRSDEFVTASSPEELDLKLSSRGF